MNLAGFQVILIKGINILLVYNILVDVQRQQVGMELPIKVFSVSSLMH